MTIPTVKGGDYAAVRAADGTWTILDVPIFADCTRSFKLPNGKTIDAKFDRAWQEAAVKRAQDRHASSGVMRAIYPRHKHDPKDDRDTLGFFLPKRVEDVELRGGKRAVTFADYVGVPDSVYAELKSRKHPYKSVELPIGADPEYTGLAWLKEPPFHDDFALQTVGKEISEAGTSEGVIGFASDAGLVAHALVRFAMPDPVAKPADKHDEPTATPAAVPPVGAVEGSPAAPVADSAVAAKPGDPAAAVDPAAAAPADSEGVKNLTTMVSAVMAQLAGFGEMLKRLAGGVQVDGSGAPRPPAVQAAFDASGTPTAEFAAVTAENASLKAKVATLETAEAKRVTVAKAVAALHGYALGGDAAEIVTAKFDAGGTVAVDGFVAGVTLVGKKDPDAAWAKESGPKAADPLTKKFPAELVAQFGAEFDLIPDVARGAITRESYIETAMAYTGLAKTETK